MEELKIPDEAINIAMEKGVPDMLVSIPPDRVVSAGIASRLNTSVLQLDFLTHRIHGTRYGSTSKRVWISQFSPAVWNMHGLNNSIIVRTNSPLDHFQRELESSFTAPDPGETSTLPDAVEVYSGVEASSDEKSFGLESDEHDEDEVDFIKTESVLLGHAGRNDESESKEEAD
ncbi:hypothetical protein PInf_017550 [Phytophthora infestans]|nr:hypothetical protein PInf_017550 [Phytophthora infestans]